MVFKQRKRILQRCTTYRIPTGHLSAAPLAVFRDPVDFSYFRSYYIEKSMVRNVLQSTGTES